MLEQHFVESRKDDPKSVSPEDFNTLLVLTRYGNDKFGEIYLEQINKYNVLSKVVQDIGPTGTSVVLITPDAERTMNTHLGMCREFNVKDIDEKLLMSSSFLYFSTHMVSPFISNLNQIPSLRPSL